ncbi:MAG: MIP/aquaporin family protein [Rudaea sp.]
MTTLHKRIFAEFLGTAALLAIVVGSGIMGQQLANGNFAVALLANSLATGTGLFVLITILGPISGAHFNPCVTVLFWAKNERSNIELLTYVVAQILGALLGVWIAHLMFDLPILSEGVKIRTGAGQWVSEFVATAGLLITILLGLRSRGEAMPALVGAYITSAYWFTASTSFANPALTLARALTDSFAGIRMEDAPGFIGSQLIATLVVILAARFLASPSAPNR